MPDSSRELAVVAPELERRLAGMSAAERVRLLVVLATDGEVPLSHELEKAIARGEVGDEAGYRATRARLVARRRARIARLAEPVRATVEASGGAVVRTCDVLPCVLVEVSAAGAHAVAMLPGVLRLQADAELRENAGGVDMRNGGQATHVLEDYDGEGPTGNSDDDVWGAVIERGRFRHTHRSFLDSGAGEARLFTFGCTATDCSSSQSGDFSLHATAVASTFFGDVEDGQIGGVSGVKASGLAPEARAYLYTVSNLFNMTTAWDHVPTRDNDVHLVSQSISTEDQGKVGYDCSGTDSVSILADALFEAGTLLIKSAGNDGGGPTECRVEKPASALSVFTVGGHGVVSHSFTEADVRAGEVRPESAWGGNTGGDFFRQGRGRSIVDVTGHFSVSDRACSSSDTSVGCWAAGTSVSTPQVAGMAIDFVDYYHDDLGSFIDNPGSLAANLLLMGDRARPGITEKLTAGFNNRFGAGRFKLRRFDDRGLDGPFWYFNGWTCISDQETWTFTLNNGAPFASDFDDLKAVVWWYDPGFHGGQELDDIDLELATKSGKSLRLSVDAFDNKEMVQFTNIGGLNAVLKLHGFRVRADDVGCGANSMKVFFAVYAEDGDREAAEELSGVERM